MSARKDFKKELDFQYELAESGYLPNTVVAYEGDIWVGVKIGNNVYSLRSLTTEFKKQTITISNAVNIPKKIYKKLSDLMTDEQLRTRGFIVGKIKGGTLQINKLGDIPEFTEVKQSLLGKMFGSRKTIITSLPDLNAWVGSFNNSKAGTVIGFYRFSNIGVRLGAIDRKSIRLMKEFDHLRAPARFQLICRRFDHEGHLSKLPVVPAALYQNDVGEFEEIPTFIQIK